MAAIHYKSFAREAAQVVLLCLAVVLIFGAFGATDKTMLIAFTIAATASVVLYRHEKAYALQIACCCMIMGASISLGGIIGYYSEVMAEILTIAYAYLAFYLPKTRQTTSILVLGSLMFLIFSAYPTPIPEGLHELGISALVALIFYIFYRFLNLSILEKDYKKTDQPVFVRSYHEKVASSTIALLSLSVATVISHYLHITYHLPNAYWIELTIMMVIQGRLFELLPRTIMRMIISSFGAIVSVIIFGVLLPQEFWTTILALSVILFLVFFCSFNYNSRVFFIEVFVLGFAFLLGDYHAILAVDRILLSIIGGGLVIITTLLLWAVDKLLPTTHN